MPASATAPHHASPGWLPWLDGWRGLSILLVLIGHLTPFDAASGLGVEMFFVLSGRLMAEMLIVRRQPLGRFVWRRVARVWPALWAYAGLMTLALGVSWWFGDQRNAIVGALAAVTFTANYLAGSVSMPYFDHAWSLAVEEHCYLVLALIAAVTGRSAPRAAVGALLLAGAAMASGWAQVHLGGGDAWYTYYRTDARAGSVLLPFAIHLLARGRSGRTAPWLACLALVPGVALCLGQPGAIRYGFGTAGLAVAVVLLDDLPAPARALLSAPPLRWLGLASFSLYLWQQPLMLLHRAGVPSLLCLAGALMLGTWSYLRIEKPARARLVAGGLRVSGNYSWTRRPRIPSRCPEQRKAGKWPT